MRKYNMKDYNERKAMVQDLKSGKLTIDEVKNYILDKVERYRIDPNEEVVGAILLPGDMKTYSIIFHNPIMKRTDGAALLLLNLEDEKLLSVNNYDISTRKWEEAVEFDLRDVDEAIASFVRYSDITDIKIAEEMRAEEEKMEPLRYTGTNYFRLCKEKAKERALLLQEDCPFRAEDKGEHDLDM